MSASKPVLDIFTGRAAAAPEQTAPAPEIHPEDVTVDVLDGVVVSTLDLAERLGPVRGGAPWTVSGGGVRDAVWVQATADTGVGNPAAATAEKGRRCLEALGHRLGGFLAELAAADPAHLYEQG